METRATDFRQEVYLLLNTVQGRPPLHIGMEAEHIGLAQGPARSHRILGKSDHQRVRVRVLFTYRLSIRRY